jgi:hypothetical protein
VPVRLAPSRSREADDSVLVKTQRVGARWIGFSDQRFAVAKDDGRSRSPKAHNQACRGLSVVVRLRRMPPVNRSSLQPTRLPLHKNQIIANALRSCRGDRSTSYSCLSITSALL